ncbi:hypothetical protein DFH11DRAFT_1620758 [Phellopilus nigrolimitatus]|nr:hypothetical protein DFH11DRAFT_1620758 [Phellopilus nigrolimitatus]
MIVPETWVDELAVQEQDEMGQAVERMEKVIFGVDVIVKDRWTLSHGAPIQCTEGKCPKASHVSCARDGGIEARIHFAEMACRTASTRRLLVVKASTWRL